MTRVSRIYEWVQGMTLVAKASDRTFTFRADDIPANLASKHIRSELRDMARRGYLTRVGKAGKREYRISDSGLHPVGSGGRLKPVERTMVIVPAALRPELMPRVQL